MKTPAASARRRGRSCAISTTAGPVRGPGKPRQYRVTASRGVTKFTWVPYIVYSPELGWCTPDRILMNVDLPAPLSPRTQVTLPASTRVVMFSRAVTLPKYLQMLRNSSRAGRRDRCVLAVLIVRALASEVVDQNGEQQHAAEEGEAAIGVPLRRLHADDRHGHDGRAESGTDHRSVTARQQATTDDCGDDVLELEAGALVGLHRSVAKGDQGSGQTAAHRHRHEQADLDPAGRNTDGSAASLLPPTAKIQLPTGSASGPRWRGL